MVKHRSVLVLLLVMSIASVLIATDDDQITIHSSRQVRLRRDALIQFIWGPSGFPAVTKLPLVDMNIKSPVDGLTKLQRVDAFHMTMDAGVTSIAYHFIPKVPNNHLVVFHNGHACTFNDGPGSGNPDFGIQRTIKALITDGYSVMAFYMPHYNPDDCYRYPAAGLPMPPDLRPDCDRESSDFQTVHDCMFPSPNPTLPGSPLKYFLEPIAVSLNYLLDPSIAVANGFPIYNQTSMIGLSGGGWTTTVYAAIDTRIKTSIQIAGSIPRYLNSIPPEGEQELREFYDIAAFQDLYVLGSYGPGRKQIQVLNRHDDCCFGQQQYVPPPLAPGTSWDSAIRSYQQNVRITLSMLGRGSFDLEVDNAAPSHMISDNVIQRIILPSLRGATPTSVWWAPIQQLIH